MKENLLIDKSIAFAARIVKLHQHLIKNKKETVISKLNNTINYEIVCLVGKRVPRIYIKDGKVVGELNYICL